MASFLRRGDDLRRLRARNLVLQHPDGSYPGVNTLLQFTTAQGDIGDTGIIVDASDNLYVPGNLGVGGTATIGSDLDVSGSAAVVGSVGVGGDVDVAGMAAVGGDLDVVGSVGVGGDLDVSGSAGIGGNLNLGGTAAVGGDLDVSGAAAVTGDLDVSGNLTVAGDFIYSGDLSVLGDVISNGGLSVLTINAPDVGACAVYSRTNDGVDAQFQAFKSRNGSGPVQAGDGLGRLNFYGMDAAPVYGLAAAQVRAYATANFTDSSNHPANLAFAVRGAGDGGVVDRMVISRSTINTYGDLTNDSGWITPVGSITMFGGASAPTGWFLCDGSLLSRATYARLFTVIGTTYGVGDGSTTFNLPNFTGRFPYGGSAGTTGGASTVTLTANNLPAHTHTFTTSTDTDPGHSHTFMLHNITDTSNSGGDTTNPKWGSGNNNNSADPYPLDNTDAWPGRIHNHTGTTDNNATTNTPVNTLPPYLGVNYIIKY